VVSRWLENFEITVRDWDCSNKFDIIVIGGNFDHQSEMDFVGSIHNSKEFIVGLMTCVFTQASAPSGITNDQTNFQHKPHIIRFQYLSSNAEKF
jgi:hypothetical protein